MTPPDRNGPTDADGSEKTTDGGSEATTPDGDEATTPDEPPLVDGRDELAERLEGASGLLAGFDFDGTLAPIVADPAEATVSGRAVRWVRALSRCDDVRVAVVSGRELADVRERVGIPGLVYGGNHGLELHRDGERQVTPAVEEYRPSLEALAGHLRSAVSNVPGCHVEEKGVTLSVHVREVPATRVPEVRELLDAVDELSAFTVSEGKQVFDVAPPVPVDKGVVMDRLEVDTPGGWLALYLGDDTTDEDAFEAIQPDGVGIHVGSNADSAARYRIPEQGQVPDFLAWLVAVWCGRGERREPVEE